MSVVSLEVAQRGQVTLPKSLRDQYNIQAGQELTLIDLGGVFVLSPKESRVERLCQQVQDEIARAGTSLEDLLAELRTRRETAEETGGTT